MPKQSITSESRDVKRVRNIILTSVALIIGVVAGYGVLYSTGLTDKISGDGFSEGDHYTLIEGAEARRTGAPVIISEYFSYGCIHCKNFIPIWEELAQDVANSRV